MAIQYFNSNDIKVFPCQNRGTQDSSIINPAARMLSEYNLTHIADTNFESYAITKTDLVSPGTFSFVLGGYYFEVSLNQDTIPLLIGSYLAVRIVKKSNDSVQTELVPFQNASARESSSSILDDGTYFLGIGISADKEDLKDLSTIELINFFDTNGNQIKSTLRPELRHGTGAGSLVAGNLTSNTATAEGSMSIGNNTQTTGVYSLAQGQNTVASGIGSHAEGTATQAVGKSSHAEGDHTTASAEAAHSEGYKTEASSTYSHAEGAFTAARNSCAHSEGKYTIASGNAAHSEGYYTKASSAYAHAEGIGKAKEGEQEPIYTTASEEGAHAEGYCTTASGKYSHSEGKNTMASGEAAHAEGFNTQATANYAHTTGVDTRANGIGSFSTGHGTIASADYQTVVGKYNNETASLFTIGNGKINTEGNIIKSNALTVDSTDIKLYNNTTIGTSDTKANLTVNGGVILNNIDTNTALAGSLCLDSQNKLVKGANYAGGTKITLNDEDKGAKEISIYAPNKLGTWEVYRYIIPVYNTNIKDWTWFSYDSLETSSTTTNVYCKKIGTNGTEPVYSGDYYMFMKKVAIGRSYMKDITIHTSDNGFNLNNIRSDSTDYIGSIEFCKFVSQEKLSNRPKVDNRFGWNSGSNEIKYGILTDSKGASIPVKLIGNSSIDDIGGIQSNLTYYYYEFLKIYVYPTLTTQELSDSEIIAKSLSTGDLTIHIIDT